MRTRSITVFAAFAVALATLAVTSGTAGAGDAGFPVTVVGDNGKVTIDRRPTRIVSLSPTATEMLFAIGAGPQVVAVDDQSDYPKGVPTTDLSGFEPNAEAIAGYEPDLVVASDTTVVDALKSLDIPVLVESAVNRISEAYGQIQDLGDATGHADGAEQLEKKMKRQIAALRTRVKDRTDDPKVYWELDDTYFSVNSKTFIGQVLDLARLDNIADATKDENDGYPQLSVEYIVDSDPDYVFLADVECCNQSAETVADRPGWADVKAVQDDHVVALDDDVASRWGPRVVTLLRQVIDATTE